MGACIDIIKQLLGTRERRPEGLTMLQALRAALPSTPGRLLCLVSTALSLSDIKRRREHRAKLKMLCSALEAEEHPAR